MTDQVMTTNIEKPKNGSLLNHRTLSYIILAVAIAVSSYLSYLKIASADAVCVHGGLFDCGTVLNSVYSEINRVPIAFLGLGTNFVILTLILGQTRIPFLRENGTIIIFGIVLFAFVYSVYLVYLQAFQIKAYCPWCLSHEALITLLFIVWTRQLMVDLRS